MSWFWVDLLMFVDGTLAAAAIALWVWGAHNEPTRYLWMIVKKPNAGNWFYVTVSSIAVLVLGRVGKDHPWWETFLAMAIVTSFLWWFVNYTHRQAIRCFADDCTEYLPDSCPCCIFYRAGKHYGFYDRKKPIPEHEDCREAR